MDYRIHPLDITEYDDMVSLWSRAGLSYRPQGRDSREAVAAQLQRPDCCFLAMYGGPKMIGVVVVTSDGRRGWINRLAVDPDYRGQGLAGKLIAEGESFLKELGIQVIGALIEEVNTPSIAAFTRSSYHFHSNILYCSKRATPED